MYFARPTQPTRDDARAHRDRADPRRATSYRIHYAEPSMPSTPTLHNPSGSSAAYELLPRLHIAREAAGAANLDDAAAALALAHSEYEKTHDGFRNANARLVDELYRSCGQPVAERVIRTIFDAITERRVNGLKRQSFRDHVTSFAMHWHWHRTLFRLAEHEDRVTFYLEPCGSGGRMINEGAYYHSAVQPLLVIRTPTAATFGEANFPSWCTHCADWNRSFLERGLNFILHEGWTPAHRYGACAAHVFKSFDKIPDEHFERVGLIRGPRQPGIRTTQVRVFTADELGELASSPESRMQAAVLAQDVASARSLIDASWNSWNGLHSAYRYRFTLFARCIRDMLGEQKARHILRISAAELVAPVLDSGETSACTWCEYWRSHCEGGVCFISGGRVVFRIPFAALIEESLVSESVDQYATYLSEALTAGIKASGRAESFGEFFVESRHFVHVLPACATRQNA